MPAATPPPSPACAGLIARLPSGSTALSKTTEQSFLILALQPRVSLRLLRNTCDFVKYFSHQKHALAAGLPVEQPVGLVRLRQLPAIREQMLDVDLAIGDEGRALGLDDRGERP